MLAISVGRSLSILSICLLFSALGRDLVKVSAVMSSVGV